MLPVSSTGRMSAALYPTRQKIRSPMQSSLLLPKVETAILLVTPLNSMYSPALNQKHRREDKTIDFDLEMLEAGPLMASGLQGSEGSMPEASKESEAHSVWGGRDHFELGGEGGGGGIAPNFSVFSA